MERVRLPEKPFEINGENYDVILKRLAHKSGLTQYRSGTSTKAVEVWQNDP